MTPGFSGGRLDRADALRNDADARVRLVADHRARVLLLDGFDPVLDGEGRLSWASVAEAEGELVLLGLDEGRPRFARLVGPEQPAAMRAPAMFRALSMMASEEAAVLGTALSLINWHATHRFCARCGAATTPFRAGWGRRCGGCGGEHFPRTDPVVIMLAVYEGRALVGRQARFPPGSYSALAGFVEPGETIEEAVRREVMEEAGVPCGAVCYLASQPWPFGGAQLMIGCIAEAEAGTITLDPRELEAAMWVSRDEVRAALAGAPDARFRPPPPFAIAHTLLERWVAEDSHL